MALFGYDQGVFGTVLNYENSLRLYHTDLMQAV
jgi:hypothetical protein